MDKITRYQNIIIDYLTEFANFGQPRPDVEKQVIADRERNHFQYVTTGWQNRSNFVYIVGLHLDIKDGKVWIWQNNTDAFVGDDLVERGIPKSDIVLAFHTPQERQHTGFALA
jgi:XisI protein